MARRWGTRKLSGSSGAGASPVLLDPICGMSVQRENAAAVRADGDNEYYFCSTGCAQAFDADRSH